MNLNKAFILGNLTRDPEIRALPSGQSVVNFGVATNRFYTDGSGQKQQQTEFHNVVAFGKNAEIVQQYLRKGSLVLIEGRIQTRNWEDAAGNKRNRTEIVTERLQLGPKNAAGPQTIYPGSKETSPNEIPIIEEGSNFPKEPPEEEINVKDIPF